MPNFIIIVSSSATNRQSQQRILKTEGHFFLHIKGSMLRWNGFPICILNKSNKRQDRLFVKLLKVSAKNSAIKLRFSQWELRHNTSKTQKIKMAYLYLPIEIFMGNCWDIIQVAIYLLTDLKLTTFLATVMIFMHTNFHGDQWKPFWVNSF